MHGAANTVSRADYRAAEVGFASLLGVSGHLGASCNPEEKSAQPHVAAGWARLPGANSRGRVENTEACHGRILDSHLQLKCELVLSVTAVAPCLLG